MRGRGRPFVGMLVAICVAGMAARVSAAILSEQAAAKIGSIAIAVTAAAAAASAASAAASSAALAALAASSASSKDPQDKERESRDLAAQEAMAVYARSTAWATWFSAGVACLALVGLFLTLRATAASARAANDAAKAANDSAQAAMDSVEVSRANHLAENRGWISLRIVSVEKLGALPSATSGGLDVKYTIVCDVANHGPAPATDLEVNTSLKVIDGEDTDRLFREFCEGFRKTPNLGEAVFPTESKQYSTSAALNFAEVEERVRARGWFSVVAFAVATYKSPGSEKLHQSGVLQFLHQADAKELAKFDRNWSGAAIQTVSVSHVFAD